MGILERICYHCLELLLCRNSMTLVSVKGLSEVGFEPTPTFVDQNTHSATSLQRRFSLESGALDRSANLTDSLNKSYICYMCMLLTNPMLYRTRKVYVMSHNIHTKSIIAVGHDKF